MAAHRTTAVCTIVGGVISPLLANVYLHYVFDLWAERWRRREARGDMMIVRYADDIVVGFEHEADAQRFRDAMRARLEEFALTLHPDKTRLIAFGRFAADRRAQRGFCQSSRQRLWPTRARLGIGPLLTEGRTKMRCIECGSEAVTERPERTAQGYRRFR